VSDKRARAESKKEFAAAFKLRNFPIPLELKGQPKFDPATYSTNSK